MKSRSGRPIHHPLPRLFVPLTTSIISVVNLYIVPSAVDMFAPDLRCPQGRRRRSTFERKGESFSIYSRGTLACCLIETCPAHRLYSAQRSRANSWSAKPASAPRVLYGRITVFELWWRWIRHVLLWEPRQLKFYSLADYPGPLMNIGHKIRDLRYLSSRHWTITSLAQQLRLEIQCSLSLRI